MLPFKSLDEATAPFTFGALRDLETVVDKVTMAVTVTGLPSSASVSLLGSLDGEDWAVLGGSSVTNGTTLVTFTDHYVRYVRAHVAALSGGTDPTVTAWIAAGHEES